MEYLIVISGWMFLYRNDTPSRRIRLKDNVEPKTLKFRCSYHLIRFWSSGESVYTCMLAYEVDHD